MIRVSGMKWILKICVSFAVKYTSHIKNGAEKIVMAV